MNKKIRLVIIEDHVLTRIGLKTALEESKIIEVVAEAEYAETGIKLVQDLEPDVVVMDLGLPNMNGIEATKQIKQLNSNVKVLILTSHDREEEILEALRSGANAYCMKDVNPSRLTSIIEGVSDGGIWIDPSIARILIKKGVFATSTETKNENTQQKKESPSPLTQRELEILQLLANGLNYLEIADKISISQYTVKSHICNILQKLSVDDRTQAVVRAMRKGWIS